MAKLAHGGAQQTLFRLANILSFGKYTHREKANPELESKLDLARRIAYHTYFLRQVANSSQQIDVTWDLSEVKRSLEFIVDHAPEADSKSASAAATIFLRTQDDETRRFCLESLTRMTNPKARNELLRLSQKKDLDQAGRDLLLSYQKAPRQPTGPVAVSGEKSTSSSTRVDQ
jgi:hypothetical protein